MYSNILPVIYGESDETQELDVASQPFKKRCIDPEMPCERVSQEALHTKHSLALGASRACHGEQCNEGLSTSRKTRCVQARDQREDASR